MFIPRCTADFPDVSEGITTSIFRLTESGAGERWNYWKKIYNMNKKNSPFLNKYFNFNFWCLLHVSKPRVHLQEDGCVYRYGITCFMCISISSNLVGRTVCSIHTVLPYLHIQPSSWKWNLRLETCRRHQKLKIGIWI